MNELAKLIFENAKAKGFHDGPKNIGEMLCLIHSEVSEALEADRGGRRANVKRFEAFGDFTRPSHDAFSFASNIKDTFEDEMADIIIRVLDLCAYLEIDIDRHVALKMEYNSRRESKHGKRY